MTIQEYRNFIVNKAKRTVKSTPSKNGARSTADDYCYRLTNRVCVEENYSLDELADNIESIVKLYAKSGGKQHIGDEGNGAVFSALKKLREFCEEQQKENEQVCWIVPCDKGFDIDAARLQFGNRLEWWQNTPLKNMRVGDRVYIYKTLSTTAEVAYRGTVTRVNIPNNETKDDSAFGGKIKGTPYDNSHYFFEFLIDEVLPKSKIGLKLLREFGLNFFQSHKLREEIVNRIDEYFEDAENADDVEYDNLLQERKVYSEGAKKQATVSFYERNPEAKAACLNHYKQKNNGKIFCEVCGFDFGIVYGDEFANRIHVHHIKSISQIGEEYEIDPISDLLPVCPNCHFVLHLSAHGSSLDVAELKKRIMARRERV